MNWYHAIHWNWSKRIGWCRSNLLTYTLYWADYDFFLHPLHEFSRSYFWHSSLMSGLYVCSFLCATNSHKIPLCCEYIMPKCVCTTVECDAVWHLFKGNGFVSEYLSSEEWSLCSEDGNSKKARRTLLHFKPNNCRITPPDWFCGISLVVWQIGDSNAELKSPIFAKFFDRIKIF